MTDPLAPVDLARLVALESQATKGPWTYRRRATTVLNHAVQDSPAHIVAITEPPGARVTEFLLDCNSATAPNEANAELLAALRNAAPALLQIAQQHQWQPIETAPKDGTWVLVYWPHWFHQPIVARVDKVGRWAGEIALSEGTDPTHWQPLPAPPEPPHA